MKANLNLFFISIIFLLHLNARAQELSYIIIRDAPDGKGNEVTTRTISADDSLVLYAAGYDQYDNFRQNENANWSVTGTLDSPGPTGSPSFNFSPVTAPTTGSIVATVGSISDGTGTITVSPGALSSLLIRTAATNGGNPVTTISMTTDESRTFWSAGYDADSNYRGDETTTMWTSSGTLGLSGGPSASIFFDPTVPVSGTLTATVDEISDTTGTITVTGSGFVNIIIRDAPGGGGNEVTTRAITADDSLVLYAAGYAFDTFVQNAMVNWTVTGSLDVTGTPILDTVFVFRPTTAPSSGTINAQMGIIQDATGTITVNPGELCSIEIRGEPCYPIVIIPSDNVCLPEYPDTTSAYVGDYLSLWAAGYDCDGNYIKATIVSYDSTSVEFTGSLECYVPTGTGSSFFLTFTGPGQGRVILNDTDTSGVIIITENPSSVITNNPIPSQSNLEQAYPNPFNPNTTIKYYLPKPEYVVMEVFNTIGQKVETLVNRYVTAGEHKIEFNAQNLPSGIYLYRIEAGEFSDVKKMILLR